jgi:putative ABC transport system permease protein
VRAVAAVARKAVFRRRLQFVIVAMVVLLSTATGVVALGLLAASHAPFDTAFTTAHGAHVGATVSASTSDSDLRATAAVSGVTATAGPFAQATAALTGSGGMPLPPATIVGRADRSGPVDRLSLDRGSWLTGPGQIVLSREYAGPIEIGSTMTADVPGKPALTVVGVADSVTGTADAWVWPGQTDVLHGTGVPTAKQMLYRFSGYGTDAVLRDDVSRVEKVLPAGAVTGTSSWLSIRTGSNRNISAFVPFVVAFAVLGIVLAVLITANVVNGAVVSGYRTIGVLKTLGFTPRQVIGVYLIQVLVPALVGSAVGVGVGLALALPLLAQTDRAYDLPSSGPGVPPEILVTVPLAALALVALSALGPATRAGRLAANQAISTGRAPRAGRGFRLRRALTATRLPRPVALGAGMPLARPARTAGTVVALLLGAMTLVFAVGLAGSLNRINDAFSRVKAVPVTVPTMAVPMMSAPPPGGGPQGGAPPGGGVGKIGPGMPPPRPTSIDVAGTLAVINAQPGTAHSTVEQDVAAHVAGFGRPVTVSTFSSDASWTGYAMVSGHWYGAGDQVVASSYLLRQADLHVGDRITVVGATGQKTVTVVGEYMDGSDQFTMVSAASTMAGVGTADPNRPGDIEIGLKPGTDVHAYVTKLSKAFPSTSTVYVDDQTQDNDEATFLVLYGLIGSLTLLLCAVAALGVVNTVVLTTRERVHDIGVLKALGMTPRQVRTMIVTSTVGTGLVGGLIAVPLGVVLHHWILPAMVAAAGEGIAPSIVHVYQPLELVALALAGVVIAVVGALLPAGWASRTRVSTALRAE